MKLMRGLSSLTEPNRKVIGLVVNSKAEQQCGFSRVALHFGANSFESEAH